MTNPEGKPISDVGIHLYEKSGDEFHKLTSTRTSQDGSYLLKVPPKNLYRFWISPHQEESKINIFPYIPIVWEIKREGRILIEKKFTLHPAGNLVIKAYDYPYQLDKGNLRKITKWHIWSTSMNNIPPPQGRLVGAGNRYTRKHGWDPDKTTPVFLLPLNLPQKLQVQWEVPDFGKVILEADNGGKGFLFTKKGEQKVINLNYELARTRYGYLKEKYEMYKKQGYQFSEKLKKEIQKAGDLLKKAKTGLGKIFGGEKAKWADKSLSHSLFASEQLEYEKAKQAITRHRKHYVTIKLLDSTKQPLSKSQVKYQQINHDFKFGFEIHRYSKLAKNTNLLDRVATRLKEAGFNLAALTPYGYKIPKAQETPFARYEQVLLDKGFDFEIKPVVYFAPWNVPDSFYEMSYSELKNKLGNYSSSLAKRFLYAKYWQISGEQNTKGRDPFNYTRGQIINLLKKATNKIKELHPNAIFMHNVTFPFCRRVPQPQMAWDNYTEPRYSMHPFTWFQLLKEYGLKFDLIGLQFRPGFYEFWQHGPTNPLIDLARVSRYLDWYGTLGKNIQITEFEIPSNYIKQHGNIIWHRKWDPKLQAEYARKFYSIAFSKPFVNGIMWWLVAYHGKGRYKNDPQNANLFDEDYKPRPAFYTLKKLITKDWSTEGKKTTDSRGQFSFRGFAGRYKITTKGIRKTLTGTFHLPEENNKVIRVVLKPR